MYDEISDRLAAVEQVNHERSDRAHLNELEKPGFFPHPRVAKWCIDPTAKKVMVARGDPQRIYCSLQVRDVVGSRTLILRRIPAASKPGTMPPFHTAVRGALPWCHIFFSTSSH